MKTAETLAGISRKYGVSVRRIVAANRLPGQKTILRAGQRLVIPGRVTVAPARKVEVLAPPARGAIRRIAPAPRHPSDGRGVVPASMILSVPDLESPPAFAWPVEGAVSSSFGRRRLGWHRGVDIVAEQGTPVYAAAGGLVIASGVEPQYGRVVKIEHEGGFVTVYAHNRDNGVDVGQWVATGQHIATVGQTGRASSPHLHFEVRHDGRVVNPLYLLPLPPRIGTEESTEDHEDEDE